MAEPLTFKLGDKTFKSGGDLVKDVEMIKQNFPGINTESLLADLQKQASSQPTDIGTSMMGAPPAPVGGIPDKLRAAAEHALDTGDKKQMASVSSGLTIAEKLFPKADGPKILPANEAVNLGEAENIPNILNNLQTVLEKNTDISGPIMGRINSWNPYNDTAQGVQSEINAARQMIGKFLEGGVLRKEDESKYEKILPTLKDTPASQLSKLKIVRDLVESRKSSVIDSLNKSGYDVKSFLQNKLASPQSSASNQGFNIDQNALKAALARKLAQQNGAMPQ